MEWATDLVAEVLSPDDRAAAVRAKIEEYLARRVSAVVVVDPDARRVATHRPSTPAVTLTEADDLLDVDDVVSGFRCSLHDIFE